MLIFWSYRVMLKCWLDNAANRPTFKELADNIMTLIEAKDKSYTLVDTQVDLERCTNYHYMDHQSLARQRSLSTQRSVSSDDVPLIWNFIAQMLVSSDDVPRIWHFSEQKSLLSRVVLLIWHLSAQRSVSSGDVPLILHFSEQKSLLSGGVLLIWYFRPIYKKTPFFKKRIFPILLFDLVDPILFLLFI